MTAYALECLLRRIGIADSEFTTDTGAGRVHLYAGGSGTSSFAAGDVFTPAATLWASPTKLASYDMLVMSCEGSISAFADQKPQTSVDNVAAYVGTGGRVLVSHLHYSWLRNSPAFSGTAAYVGSLTAPPAGVAVTVNQTFPKGVALAEWLAGPSVNASPTPGQLVTNGSEHSVTSVTAPTTEWLTLPSNPSDTLNRRSVQHLSFNAPVADPPALHCGRVGFTDIHIKIGVGSGSGGDDSTPAKPFPGGCKTNDMSAQQKAVEFLLFDLGSCIQPDSVPPAAP